MKRRTKRKSPSRERYEKKNRVIAFRVREEVYLRHQEVKKKTGLSNTKILETALGLYEMKIGTKEEIWQEAYDKGWDEGVNAAEALYAVTYRCSNCGKEMVVTSEKEKKAIREYMHKHGWGHGDCNNPGI
jgi:predicted RNA-binding Zn-ribbon protein involved in translation (DUF1610 family)